MRTLGGPLLTALQQPGTTLAMLVDIVTVGGKGFYFTSSDVDVAYGGNVYSAANGCDPSQVRTVLGTATESVTVDVLITDTGISAAIIESGSLDGAALRVLVVDFTNPTSAAIFFAGFVSAASYKDRITASIEAQPLLSQNTALCSEVYSSNCRADLGDVRCKVNIAGLAANVAITEYLSLQQFVVNDTHADSYWQAGVLEFTSGNNETFSFEIQDSTAEGLITLRGLMPFVADVGDTITLYPGCDKSPTMCQSRYANIANFRGEPFAIAPWICTSNATTTTTTSDTSTTSKRTLYLYQSVPPYPGILYFPTLGPITADGARIPDWGPVNDQWGFHGSTGTGTSGGSGSGSGSTAPGSLPPVWVVSSKLTAGTYGTFTVTWQQEIALTDDQAALVRLTYPDA